MSEPEHQPAAVRAEDIVGMLVVEPEPAREPHDFGAGAERQPMKEALIAQSVARDQRRRDLLINLGRTAVAKSNWGVP